MRLGIVVPAYIPGNENIYRNAALINSMLDAAISKLKEGDHPIIHTDRGCHYRWPGWIERMEKAHLQRSMSKKGCSPDNSACEGFFGHVKNEMFYGFSWADVSVEAFAKVIDDYMIWYREKRIKCSLGGMSPLEYRLNLRPSQIMCKPRLWCRMGAP